MRKKVILCYFFWSIINLAYAQKKSFNERYVEVSVSLIATDIQQARRVSDSLLNVAKTDEERAKAYMLSANIHKNLEERAFAIQQATYADEIAKASLNPTWQAGTAGFLSTSFREVGLLKAAARYINQAEEANNKLVDNPMHILTKINIFHERAFQAMAAGDYEKAENAVLKASKFITFSGEEDKHSRLIKATNHQLLGLCYLYLGSLKEAEKMYQSSLKQIGDEESNLKPYIFRGLAEIALAQDSVAKAKEYLGRAAPYLETSGFEELKANVYRTSVKYYWKIGDIDNGKRYEDLLTKIKDEQEREARRVSDELFEEMYNAKESYRSKFKIAVITVFCLAIIAIFLALYVFFLRRTKSTDAVMEDDERITSKNPELLNTDNGEIRDINMSKETEQRLLRDIDRYEEELYFLDKNISLSSIAKALNTNQRYVSYIIRKYRGKDFYSYIQSCRIQFIINRIKADPALLDYKLAHLADMSGFANLSKFSIAFKAETGLPPSAFVHFRKKELGRG